MTPLNRILNPFFSLFTSRTDRSSTAQHKPRMEKTAPTTSEDAEQAFLASIAHFPAKEQQERIQRRLWYARMAQRQGIMEAEHLAEAQYHRTNER